MLHAPTLARGALLFNVCQAAVVKSEVFAGETSTLTILACCSGVAFSKNVSSSTDNIGEGRDCEPSLLYVLVIRHGLDT